MSAENPLLRGTPRAPNKGPNDRLDQTLGVPHEIKINRYISQSTEWALPDKIFLCIKHSQTPKRGLDFFAGSNIGGTT